MPSPELSVDRDPLGAGREFAVAVRTTPLRVTSAPGNGGAAAYAIVLDASPSMGVAADAARTVSRWTLALRAVEFLLRMLPDRDEIHLVTFSSDATVVSTGETVTRLRGKQMPPAPETFGGTNIQAGLEAAGKLLRRSSAGSRRMILVSDGEPNTGITTAAGLAEIATRFATADIYTDAVGMGAEADGNLLHALSEYGVFGHVETADDAGRVMTEVFGMIGRRGQNLAAHGGEIRLEIHPLFPVLGVYQINPSRRLLKADVVTDPDVGQVVTIPLGAVGVAEQQPLFAVRLRAPDKLVEKKLPIIKATGTLRSGGGQTPLDPAAAEISGIAAKEVIRLDNIMPQIQMAELEEKTAELLTRASPATHAAIYRDALNAARRAGLDELADAYRASLTALEGGRDAGDVFNKERSRSSSSATNPDSVLAATPVFDPTLAGGREPGSRRIGECTPREEVTEDW